MVPLSIQLYTVREMAAKDFVGVLKKIAAIGFKGVEFAGLHGHSPKDLRKVLDDLGLVASSSHCPAVTKENLSESVDTARTLGYTMLISGRKADAFKTAADIARVAADYEAAAAMLPKGITVGYHNHAWEFDKVDGRLAMEILLEKAPSMFSQVDIYWAANFGAVDPAAFIRKHQAHPRAAPEGRAACQGQEAHGPGQGQGRPGGEHRGGRPEGPRVGGLRDGRLRRRRHDRRRRELPVPGGPETGGGQ